MNPHKLIDAYQPTENLRLGADYAPLQPTTHFPFPDDRGSLANATLRCIGLGECRKHDGGTMCPSYMATLEEQHSTRGRAHLLWELLQGEVVRRRLAERRRETGARPLPVVQGVQVRVPDQRRPRDLPRRVSLALLRAPARPLHAYAFGMVDRWLQFASVAPRAANLLMQTPGLVTAARRALHLAPERQLPRLAPVSFRTWARREGIAHVGRSAPARATSASGNVALLWIDTFNNHFHPETTQAGIDVLRAAGFQPVVPARRLCCGRPLYDFGMLDHARAYLQTIMDELGEQIDAGVPIIVLEPSCASVFRDELRNLFPSDARATRLREQTFLLSDFLETRAPGFQLPRLSKKVLLHGHCHHKALMKTKAEESLLRKMGTTLEAPDTGCCGMAGAFGFEADKYAVSQAIGERVLLPAVRQAAADTLIVSDGFSCREQIYQATGRRTVHLAEVIKLGLNTQFD